MRTILHSDLNSFYASVECRENPALADKPLAVCGSQENRHGIVLAKNQIAKEYGVKTGWPIWKARSVCPGLIIRNPNFPLYLDYSRRVRKIYCEYTYLVESFGIDECWLDVTESRSLFGDGLTIANRIRERVKKEIGITCSIGISYNKIFAKLGSDMKKPDAVTVILPEDLETKVFSLPCEEMLYIGSATKRKLNNISVYTIGDLANTNPALLEKILGKWGRTLWHLANGMDTSPVYCSDFEREIKSVGNSLTAPRDITEKNEAKMLLFVLSESVGQRLRKHGLLGKTVQVTIRDNSFQTIERQGNLDFHTNVTMEIYREAVRIFFSSWEWQRDIRMLGVRIMSLVPSGEFIQLSLFIDKKHEKQELVDACIDKLRERFGYEKIKRAFVLKGDVSWYKYLESEGSSAFNLK